MSATVHWRTGRTGEGATGGDEHTRARLERGGGERPERERPERAHRDEAHRRGMEVVVVGGGAGTSGLKVIGRRTSASRDTLQNCTTVMISPAGGSTTAATRAT